MDMTSPIYALYYMKFQGGALFTKMGLCLPNQCFEQFDGYMQLLGGIMQAE